MLKLLEIKRVGKKRLEQLKLKKKKESTIQASIPLTAEQKKENEKRSQASDFENTQDLFGGVEVESGYESVKVVDDDQLFGNDDDDESPTTQRGSSPLDTFKPSSGKDFEKFARMLGEKIVPYEESYHYVDFLKHLLKEISGELAPEQIKELITALNVITNAKIKNQSTSKKKKPVKKKAVQREVVEEDLVEDEYDNFM
eukprot:TRINITY_DN4692_c0_g1_i4.p1 TRINITY_DN4692_c0_g1~~TRINITY_DN4692_c0_g1_i4.p1  ORF type:complete len:199 (+),score=62.48 TRINITY_DN4692_c0_g1_i4:140-736(+)